MPSHSPTAGPLPAYNRVRGETHRMSRNFYALAATLAAFSLIACGMAFVPSSFQPGLPANGTLWKTLSLILLVGALASALVGMMTNLFEQVDRRSEQRRLADRARRRKL